MDVGNDRFSFLNVGGTESIQRDDKERRTNKPAKRKYDGYDSENRLLRYWVLNYIII